MRFRMFMICLLAFVMHIPFLHLPPNGYHKWREVDTATVSENYFREAMQFAYPRVNVENADGLRVLGTEMPIYTFLTASLYQSFGFSHIWPRLLTLLAYIVFILSLSFYVTKRRELMVFLGAFSPLSFFYGVKIQPDMLALAAMSISFLSYRSWLNSQEHRDRFFFGLSTVLAIIIAGGIKPHYLCVGLPMLSITPLKQLPKATVIALLGLLPIWLWFKHARKLAEEYGEGYFYLGSSVFENLQFVATYNFWQNTVLTWPFELISLPPLIFASLFYVHKEAWRIAWIVGCFVVFFIAAGHCATPHDYYYLPMSVPLLVACHQVLVRFQKWIPFVCVALVVYAPMRLRNRVELQSDFYEARALNIQRADVVDHMPGRVLYWLGAKGKRFTEPHTEHTQSLYMDKRFQSDKSTDVSPSIVRLDPLYELKTDDLE